MGRPKGGKNKYWSKEEKLKLIKEHLDNNISTNEITTRENISNGMYNNWLKKYLEYGEKGLENKKKPGNPLSKYMNKKKLNDIEKLEYENMKLRIENERLKKGYVMEGDGQVVIFNGSNVKVNKKMYKKLKIKMYKKCNQLCIGSETSESIFNLSFKR